MTEAQAARGRGVSRTLKVEFALFYVIVPVAGAVLLPANAMFGLLFGMTALGLLLLQITPGFGWHELTRGWHRVDWARVAGLALLTAAAAWAVLQATRPGAMFFLPRERPQLMLAIALLYPLLSALPQEIVFRPLFFRRYGALFGHERLALTVNAAVFSLAHLMYWSWIVAAMTFVGGLAFAEAYARRGSFPTAVVQHAVAGIVLFAMGMGVYFYSGAVTRPF
ncbi:CPBP family intramembrane glutamic endopeptidase [Meridianimarinicoccus sp. RP-17]|uniref:CPBP family intramembrane glutamic endopeptidase n=1 Tax=Meridianimarinicoccus zhengii TaxID=2056810 RepID=UPI000DAD4260|nr:CPBP family intramembrane glutamic endopeptidase [Phycocomes zhengii]